MLGVPELDACHEPCRGPTGGTFIRQDSELRTLIAPVERVIEYTRRGARTHFSLDRPSFDRIDKGANTRPVGARQAYGVPANAPVFCAHDRVLGCSTERRSTGQPGHNTAWPKEPEPPDRSAARDLQHLLPLPPGSRGSIESGSVTGFATGRTCGRNRKPNTSSPSRGERGDLSGGRRQFAGGGGRQDRRSKNESACNRHDKRFGDEESKTCR